MGSRLHYCNGYKHSSDFGVIDYSKNGGDINPECTPIDKEIDRMIADNGWQEQTLVVFLKGVIDEGHHSNIICHYYMKNCMVFKSVGIYGDIRGGNWLIALNQLK